MNYHHFVLFFLLLASFTVFLREMLLAKETKSFSSCFLPLTTVVAFMCSYSNFDISCSNMNNQNIIIILDDI